MTGFVDKLRLKGQAEEDTWFARRDRELVDALHGKTVAQARCTRGGAPVLRIVSGGQTGVDRAALDAAMLLGLDTGGWCPRDRRSEDGPIDSRYPLRETPDLAYAQRTEWNVRDSDATLILCRGEPRGGTARTADLARRYGRPLLVVDLDAGAGPGPALDWLHAHAIRVLNVAGPRESDARGRAGVPGGRGREGRGAPGIHAESLAWLLALLRAASGGPGQAEGDKQ
jgi:hypothetical protein